MKMLFRIFYSCRFQNMGFHASQPGFNAGHPQTSPQLGAGSGGGASSAGGGMHMAKWHIPQSAQSNCQSLSNY